MSTKAACIAELTTNYENAVEAFAERYAGATTANQKKLKDNRDNAQKALQKAQAKAMSGNSAALEEALTSLKDANQVAKDGLTEMKHIVELLKDLEKATKWATKLVALAL